MPTSTTTISSTTTQYSSESQTTEVYEVPTFAKRTLIVSILTEIISASVTIFVSVHMLTLCLRLQFQYAGLTIAFGLVTFVLYLATAYTTYSKYRACSLTVTTIALIVTFLLCINEITSWICTEESYSMETSCHNFRNAVNVCKWLPPKRKKKTTNEPEGSTEVAPKMEQSFTEGRITLIFLSFVSLLCCAITLVLLFVAVKMGKPVYLNRRRHKTSIIVGDKKNVDLSSKNKIQNMVHTLASDQETKYYDEKKAIVVVEEESKTLSGKNQKPNEKDPVPPKDSTDIKQIDATFNKHLTSGKKQSKYASKISGTRKSPESTSSPSPVTSSTDYEERKRRKLEEKFRTQKAISKRRK